MLPIIAAALAPVLAQMVQAGLGTLAGAIEAKGKDVIEQKLGVQIPDTPVGLTPEKISELQQAQMKHEEFLIQAAAEADKSSQEEVTKRWQADMSSDVWLAKNIRPLVLLGLFLLLLGMVVADALGATFSDATYGLVTAAVNIVFIAYFSGRSLEKGVAIWKGKNVAG